MRNLFTALTIVLLSAVAVSAQLLTISEFKQKAINDTLKKGEKIAGRVTVSNQFRNTSYIQDASGGIAVFNSNFRSGVQVGDSVEFTGGQLQDFQATTGQPGTGLFEIAGSKVVFTKIPVPTVEQTPKTVAIASVNEAFEGLLIRLRNVTFTTTGAFQADKNYFVKNSNGDSIQVRIDGGTEIAVNSLSIPAGAIDLVAVVSQFRGTYQLIPRFASDLGIDFSIDTVAKSSTLDMVCWNVKRFMDPTDTNMKDKTLQLAKVKQIIDSMDADVIALEEVSSPEGFQRLLDTLGGKYEGTLATEIDQPQKMAFLYKKGVITKIKSELAVNGGAQAWANGRFPLRLEFDATINGTTKRINAFAIHAKANSQTTAMEDYNRRVVDFETFHAYLNSFYSNVPAVLLGDFNDDVTTSIVGANLPSSFKIFADDSQNWKVATKELSDKKLVSYIPGDGAMIDHIIVSNEVAPSLYKTKLEAPQAYVSSYTSTVSDHVPVSIRLYLNQVTTNVNEENYVENTSFKISPNPAQNICNVEIENLSAGNLSLEIFDVLGNKVNSALSEFVSPQVRYVSVDTQLLASGIYNVVLTKNGISQSKKLVVNK